MIQFELKPKKRGNWRPEVILSVKVRGEMFPHRPFIPAVLLTSHRRDTPWPDWYNHTPALSTFDFSNMAKSEDDIHGLCTSPKRGVDVTNKLLTIPLFGRDTAFYLEDKIVLDEEHHLWLPWRPGARPDYTDYIKRFQYILRWLKMKIEQCDSGQNDGVKLTLERRDYPVRVNNIGRKLNIGGIINDED